MSRFAVIVIACVLAASGAIAGTSGEFLFIQDAVAGRGGIWGVDSSGANFFAVTAPSGAGFSTTEPPYPNPNIYEFSQARSNGRIAFSSTTNDTDSRRIHIMNGDGSGVTQITFHNPSASTSQDHIRPSISNDGSKVAYVNGETIAPPGSISNNNVNCSGQETAGLWVVNSDGTNAHVIRTVNWSLVSYCNAGAVVDAVWSPNGSQLIVKDSLGDPNANCGFEVVVINADGSNQRALACNNNWGLAQVGLDWSPDGTKAMALVACGGVGGGPNCTQWIIWDTSTWNVISVIPTPSGNDEFLTRFSPDSTLLAYFDQNVTPHTIQIMDLSGNPVSSINMSSVNVSPGGFAGSLWWGTSTPGTLQNMTLGVPSVYVNSCPNYTVQLQPSTFNSGGALVTHGFSSVNFDNLTGDGDSWHIDGFGNAYFVATRNSGTATIQLANFGVTSNTIPLTTDSSCTCQTSVPGLNVTRGGLRYVASSQAQFLQTLTVTNGSGSPVTGPVNIVIQNLPSTVTLTNASGASGCTSSGSAFVTVVPANGSLAAGQSASVQLNFRDPSLGGFTYTTAVTAGAGAP
jgi:hypothetical protein